VDEALNINARDVTPESAEILFRAWFTMESLTHTYADLKLTFEDARGKRERGRGGGEEG
jgi:hypothetical protein